MPEKYDLIIVGGGPAGASALAALQSAGLNILLLDRSDFPRDKICGDAIPGHVVRWLREHAPDMCAEMFGLEEKALIRSSTVVASNQARFTVDWSIETFNAPRLHFDAKLLQLARARTQHEFRSGTAVEQVVESPEGVRVHLKNGTELLTDYLIAADGANGPCARDLLGLRIDPDHHCAAVRAYFSGVSGVNPTANEVHVLRDYLPGYFWIFPVGENLVNVGYGMLSRDVSARRLNLRKLLPEILEMPALRERFRGATQLGKVTGFGLPLGTRHHRVHTDRTCLTGDAGSLIDPLYGHGIDKAVISGWLAGEAVRARVGGNQEAFPAYEAEVRRKWSDEFDRSARLRDRVMQYPRLLDFVVRVASLPGIRQLARKIVV